MRKFIVFFNLVMAVAVVSGQVPQLWHTTGIGGGGALFAPSVNPSDANDFYVACDMSDLFHTTDNGMSYSIVDFRELQSSHNSAVRFTNNPSIRYCINYSNNQVLPVKSTDGGITWNTLSGNPDGSSETFSIWADYNNPLRVIMSYYGIVYFSADGGATFTNIHNCVSSGAGVLVSGVFFDGLNIYIGTNDGIIESLNGGTTFSVLATTGLPANERIGSFAAAKQGGTLRFFCVTSDVGNVYAGLPGSDYWGFLAGVYSMDNNSGTWTSRMTNITLGSDYLMFVAMAENDISTAYLGGSTSAASPNVMKTTDGGQQWNHVFNTANNQNIITGWCGSGGDHQWSWSECLFGIAVSAADKNTVILTDYSNPTITHDGGTTWTQAYVATADQHPAGAATPKYQYYHSVGMENTACWYIDWTGQNNIFAAYTDIYGMRSKDGGQSWGFDYTGPLTNTMYCLKKNNAGTILYAATSSVHDLYKSYRLQDNIIDASGVSGKIIFSSDTGATWALLHDFLHPVYWLATDPGNSERMYAAVVNNTQGLGGIWVTNNLSAGASSTWTHLLPPPRTEGHPAAITVLPDGKLLCSFSGRRNPAGAFTASSGVFVYDPVATSWTDKSDPGMYYWCHDVVTDYADPQNTWYCGVYSGWGGAPNDLGGLYKTTNAGLSWTRILQGVDVSSCTFNPANSNELYVTTAGSGLWFSSNAPAATPVFTQVGSYDFGSPERVFFDPNSAGKIWVASFGHGMQWGDNNSGAVAKTDDSKEISLYPNPVQDVLHVRVPGNATNAACRVSIYDNTGRLLIKNNIFSAVAEITVSSLSQGLYIVNVFDGERNYSTRFVKD